MPDRNHRFSRAEILDLVDRLSRDGFPYTLHAYPTHTGEPFRYPWTGPMAYEVHITGMPRHETGEGHAGGLRELLAVVEEYGLRVWSFNEMALDGGGDSQSGHDWHARLLGDDKGQETA